MPRLAITRYTPSFEFDGRVRAWQEKEHTISAGGAQVHLTQIECSLLEHLGARLNQTVPSRKMVDPMWGRHAGRGLHSLRSVVKNVRRKLEPDAGRPRYLVLDRTLGYRLQSP